MEEFLIQHARFYAERGSNVFGECRDMAEMRTKRWPAVFSVLA
jgi:hypothetical protein